jgi:hypothetical protein
MGESPDQRGLQKFNKAQNPQFASRKPLHEREVNAEGIASLGLDSGMF